VIIFEYNIHDESKILSGFLIIGQENKHSGAITSYFVTRYCYVYLVYNLLAGYSVLNQVQKLSNLSVRTNSGG
jgi:hypothetical protein